MTCSQCGRPGPDQVPAHEMTVTDGYLHPECYAALERGAIPSVTLRRRRRWGW